MNFIRLDFQTIKQYLTLKQLVLYASIILLLSYTMNNFSFVIGMLMMYGLFYAAYPFAIGDKTQTDILYASLPLKKQHIVTGRYLFALFINLITAVASFLITALVANVFQKDYDRFSSILTILICLFLYTIVESIQFPIYFKLGYTKAKIITLFPILLIPLIVILMTSWIKEEVWMSAIMWMEGNVLLVCFAMLVLWCCILFASVQVSYRIYQKRDF
jgi:ABC-type transport system involved in multi-copper enzyme maturation permease subunit